MAAVQRACASQRYVSLLLVLLVFGPNCGSFVWHGRPQATSAPSNFKHAPVHPAVQTRPATAWWANEI